MLVRIICENHIFELHIRTHVEMWYALKQIRFKQPIIQYRQDILDISILIGLVTHT